MSDMSLTNYRIVNIKQYYWEKQENEKAIMLRYDALSIKYIKMEK